MKNPSSRVPHQLRMIVLLVLLVTVAAVPRTASALQYGLVGSESLESQVFTGSRTLNWVPGSVTIGEPGAIIVNSAYLSYDNANAIECGYSWDRLADGTYRGPYVFAVSMLDGVYTFSGALSTCARGQWYTWFIRPSATGPLWFEYGFDSTKLGQFYLGRSAGRVVYTGAEHSSALASFGSVFKDMAWQRNKTNDWYRWLNFQPIDSDYYYNIGSTSDRFGWYTVKVN